MAATSVYQASGIIQTNDNFLRLMTLLNHTGLELYYKLFHDSHYGGFATEPENLFKELKAYQDEIKSLKKAGLITEEDYLLVFPTSEETYSQEFNVGLYHILSQHCIKSFPHVTKENTGESENNSSPAMFIDQMEKLQDIMLDKTLKNKVSESTSEFTAKWNEIISILKILNYDTSKVTELQSNILDENKRYRFALLRSEIDLLLQQCEELIKTTKINTFTLDKLTTNFKQAVSLSTPDNNNGSNYFDKPIKDLQDQVSLTLKMLSVLHDNSEKLKPDIKFWKEMNVEGDVIIFDEKLSKLKNQVNEQSDVIGNLFSTISLKIVKIKEKVTSNADIVKHIGSPQSGK